MEARSTSVRWTYERFAQLPGTEDDGRRREIIAGELVVTSAPRPLHQAIVYRLGQAIGDFVDDHDLGSVLPGPIDVLFAEGDYLEPDLVFVRRDRREIISERAIEAAPDLVVEVLSPSTAARDRGIKRERYALYRVPEYWVADPDRQCIEVYRPDSGAGPARTATDVLRWKPINDGPVLELAVPEILRGLNE